MQTDKFWMSALWGRLGAAIILIGGSVLQQLGFHVTQDQMDAANGLIGSLIANIHIFIAAAMVIVSKLREQSKARAPAPALSPSGKSGFIVMRLILVILLSAFIASAVVSLAGCANNQSATQQIAARTDNPATIALATYADAQDAYISAAETYVPYQAALQKLHPDINAKIIGYFQRANQILDAWGVNGNVSANDKQSFRDYLRQISIQAAEALQQKQE